MAPAAALGGRPAWGRRGTQHSDKWLTFKWTLAVFSSWFGVVSVLGGSEEQRGQSVPQGLTVRTKGA